VEEHVTTLPEEKENELSAHLYPNLKLDITEKTPKQFSDSKTFDSYRARFHEITLHHP